MVEYSFWLDLCSQLRRLRYLHIHYEEVTTAISYYSSVTTVTELLICMLLCVGQKAQKRVQTSTTIQTLPHVTRTQMASWQFLYRVWVVLLRRGAKESYKEKNQKKCINLVIGLIHFKLTGWHFESRNVVIATVSKSGLLGICQTLRGLTHVEMIGDVL